MRAQLVPFHIWSSTKLFLFCHRYGKCTNCFDSLSIRNVCALARTPATNAIWQILLKLNLIGSQPNRLPIPNRQRDKHQQPNNFQENKISLFAANIVEMHAHFLSVSSISNYYDCAFGVHSRQILELITWNAWTEMIMSMRIVSVTQFNWTAEKKSTYTHTQLPTRQRPNVYCMHISFPFYRATFNQSFNGITATTTTNLTKRKRKTPAWYMPIASIINHSCSLFIAFVVEKNCIRHRAL